MPADDSNLVRHRRRLDLDPGNDDDNDGVVETPLDDAEDLVWTWLPLALVAFAVVALGSMYFISSHDHMTSYFHTIHHGPRFIMTDGQREVRLSRQELASYNGVDKSKLYLAILGQVFDVTAGARHYGVNGAYRHFIGVDRSRAFSSGIKTDGEDITIGHAQPIIGTIRSRIRQAQAQVDTEAAIERCNMQWTADAGATTIWCQDASKYPRAYGSSDNSMCGCFTTTELATQNLPLYKACTDKRCVVPS
ncbi:hypothetical protein DYB28_000988 [Aphanomyces astaci]|uniref:Cytochrome b5 heme-binding domain-containing protein n=1 Tax=Aphanomyces astaci TaxID=112090 RepID=A0A397FXL9_APHAT|nr:hypothetical protein DYB25_005370 [Aphanomyces astaci]RHX98872.1 hypothetical protein DYB36_006316 [Aphanomyces astaci]RHY37872.1 hypothetical protein DYB38_005843 [Aphanomyces astaci]RHY59561.1 hypothetical protein DYB34_006139 [Aphanomyces astaci]RHY63303.1 hypothetical protein DYB30_003494 [Aphanomyces astaci]